MDTHLFSFANDMYVEATSKLAAMATFVNELKGNPAAPALLKTFAAEIRAIVDETADRPSAQSHRFYDSLNRLEQTIDELRGTETSRQQVLDGIEVCRDAVTALARDLSRRCTSQHRRTTPRAKTHAAA